jgi:gentisate 1,2-dioxygenase
MTENVSPATQPIGAEGAAMFRTPSNAFSLETPPVPCHLFEQERLRALDPETPTGPIALDLSERLGLTYPATTPTLLASYLVIRPHDEHRTVAEATAQVSYVATGNGMSRQGDAEITWKAGDVICFPGGTPVVHQSGAERALLISCTDEPTLAFLGVRPRAAEVGVVAPTRFRGEEIDRILEDVHSRTGDDVAGKAVFCTSPIGERTSTITPMIVSVINTLEAGGDQRGHRHNAVALTFCIEGEGCYSMVGGRRVDWKPFGVMVTPPGEPHSHHNRGSRLMRSFVMQDSGLYYHARTVGFSYCD